MERGPILEKIKAHIISEYIDSSDTSDFNLDSPLVSSGVIDSINILQVVDFLEDNFDLEFEPHEVDQSNLNNINLMADFVIRKLTA